MNPVSIPIPGPLQEARFVDRPHRFLVRAELGDGTLVEAHLPDPGALRGLLVTGCSIWIRPVDSKTRKTRWSAELVRATDDNGLVSVDTSLPNPLISEALGRHALEELDGWTLVRPEFGLRGSRFDFLLERPEVGEGPDRLILEVKSVTLVDGRLGLFPDSVTSRGRRHLLVLRDLAASGRWHAALLFLAQRGDLDRIAPARHIDPAFAEAVEQAAAAGVRLMGRKCNVFEDRLELGEAVPIVDEAP